ncbi:Ig-like domain-containing protein [Pyxidicoccus xibeiensis]|uniref:Ig-like domain-containing protein n=1 Tax=Pyxidicoccus xibeiensis TaxID=2906759 RepID=UPI0020A7E7C7|nr:Ig-like domain-containing protein [Pyxidicoccus xibeiensis]MCP3143791.1 Ig-like domain-containing protein [Pyxidicoccus xibeiensis]
MLRFSVLCALSTAAMAACPTDPGNLPPTATAQSLSTDEDVGLSGAVTGTDPEGGALTYAMVAQPGHGSVTLSPGGAFVYTPAAHFHGGDSFSFRAHDGTNNSQPAVVSLTVRPVNDPPSVASASLGQGPFRSGDTLTVVPSGWADVDGDAEGYRFEWFVNGVAVSGASTASLLAPHFKRGDSVRCSVVPFDGRTPGPAVTTATVTVLNTPPSVGSASLGAGPFRTSDILTCAVSGVSDRDGDSVSLTYKWLRNAFPVGGVTTATLNGASEFSKGDTLSCVVTPSDGTDSGAAVASGTITVENTPPTMTTARIPAGSYRTDDTVTCVASGFQDVDFDAPDYRYRWLVNDAPVAGQLSAVLPGTAFKRGDSVRCVAAPDDGSAVGAEVTSSPVTIVNSAPTLASVSMGSGPFGTDSVIACTPSGFADPDGDAPVYLYTWLKNGAVIAGQTASTLDGASQFDAGDEVRCRVTPSDGTQSGAPVDSSSTHIESPPGRFTGVSIGTGPFFTHDVLTAVATGPGGAQYDPTGFRYQWYRDGLAIQGATSRTLDGTVHFSKGAVISCAMTEYDGTQTGTTLQSNTVTIQNSTPTLTGASLGSGPYYVTSTLDCAAQGQGDADGDALTSTYAWYVNGAVVAGWTRPFLDSRKFRKGDSLSCRLSVSDGTVSTAVVTSNTVTIQNSAPVTSYQDGVGVFAGKAASGAVSAYDPDGDPVVGHALASGSSQGTVVLDDAVAGRFTFTANATARGNTTFTFTATDGFDTSVPGVVKVRVHAGRRLARGETFGCAIASDRTLRCWGGNASGQLGNGTKQDSAAPVQEALGLSDWASVAVGGAGFFNSATGHVCAIRLDGSLYCWGRNDHGQLGVGSTGGDVTRPTRVDPGPWLEVAAGGSFTCGVKQGGTLWCWGRNANGEIGQGVTGGTYASPVRVGGANGWATLAAGDQHSCAISFEGGLACWGQGSAHALGNGSTLNRATPTAVSVPGAAWVQVGGHVQRTYAVREDGALWGWGATSGVRGAPYDTSPRLIDTGWREVSPGYDHFCGVKTTGRLHCWGANGYGALGLGLRTVESGAGPVGTATDWVEVSSALHGSCGRRSDGTTWCWGDNMLGQTATGTDQSHLVPTPVGTATNWREVFVRLWGSQVGSLGAGACATRTDGTLWCTGRGDVGNGSTESPKVFTEASSGVSPWASPGAGMLHTCATRTDGSLWCWGNGGSGELGSGGTSGNPRVAQVGTALDWAQGKTDLGAGTKFTCARKTDGSLHCWGNNASGQLGVGDRVNRLVPTRVSVGSTWRSVSAGVEHACGIQTDGSLWCWGSNVHGQLGVHPGSANVPLSCGSGVACATSPLRIGTANDWAKVAVGDDFTCALRSTGSLSCWGRNDVGQLGGGVTGPQLCGGAPPLGCSPEPLAVGTGFADVWAGKAHACGRKSVGQLLCWGLNESGQVGDGTRDNRLSPVELDSGSVGWVDVSTGDDLTCAVREGAGGTRPLWCWGRSQEGAFGDDHGWKLTPVQTLLP